MAYVERMLVLLEWIEVVVKWYKERYKRIED